jgi:formate hydrogenlyase subunit 6/NADH:ubiquinone oxidoreductase subunit I
MYMYMARLLPPAVIPRRFRQIHFLQYFICIRCRHDVHACYSIAAIEEEASE